MGNGLSGTTTEPRGIHRRIEFTVTPSLKARLDARVEKHGPDECWPWTGAPRNGYGAIKNKGSVLGTHVVAFRIYNGEIPTGLLVTHSCDNRLCCNPAHLVAGTHQKNIQEAFERSDVNTMTGEKSYNAVFTAEIVQRARSLRMIRNFSSGLIAEALGIGRKTVESMLAGKTWADLQPPSRSEAKAILVHFSRPTVH